MGATAEAVAEQLHITREEQDAFSFASQQKAIAAIDAGKFKDEIVPVVVPQGRKKPPIVFDTDEFPKRDTSMEKMAKLKPCFNIKKDAEGRVFGTSELTGTVTPAAPTLTAPTSRMQDSDIASLVQLRQTVESVVQFVQGAASGTQSAS